MVELILVVPKSLTTALNTGGCNPSVNILFIILGGAPRNLSP